MPILVRETQTTYPDGTVEDVKEWDYLPLELQKIEEELNETSDEDSDSDEGYSSNEEEEEEECIEECGGTVCEDPTCCSQIRCGECEPLQLEAMED